MDRNEVFLIDTLIIGAGGHGKVVREILSLGSTYRPVGFVDADPTLAGTAVAGLPVIGPVTQLSRLAKKHKATAVIVAIGDNRVRAEYARTVEQNGLVLATAVHSSAVVSPSAKIGRNVVIAAGVIICADAEIGDSAIINTAASVDHECVVGPAVHVCPGARLAGRVEVAAGATIGMGANVIQCRRIGDGAFVGAGAVVLTDVPPGVTVVGVPARVVRRAAA